MKVEFKNLEDMDTVNKEDYKDVFFENEQMYEEDVELFASIFNKEMTANERNFFLKMKEKVEGEFAPSADIIMLEENNKDKIYLIRYYFSEFKIGRLNCDEAIYSITFAQAIKSDINILLGRHITLLEWLREIDFKGLNYNGNCITNRH